LRWRHAHRAISATAPRSGRKSTPVPRSSAPDTSQQGHWTKVQLRPARAGSHNSRHLKNFGTTFRGRARQRHARRDQGGAEMTIRIVDAVLTLSVACLITPATAQTPAQDVTAAMQGELATIGCNQALTNVGVQ
jgi:hypothetical protein